MGEGWIGKAGGVSGWQLYVQRCPANNGSAHLLYPLSPLTHSHSTVAGGFELTSYTTRPTPFTSPIIRVATAAKSRISNG